MSCSGPYAMETTLPSMLRWTCPWLGVGLTTLGLLRIVAPSTATWTCSVPPVTVWPAFGSIIEIVPVDFGRLVAGAAPLLLPPPHPATETRTSSSAAHLGTLVNRVRPTHLLLLCGRPVAGRQRCPAYRPES